MEFSFSLFRDTSSPLQITTVSFYQYYFISQACQNHAFCYRYIFQNYSHNWKLIIILIFFFLSNPPLPFPCISLLLPIYFCQWKGEKTENNKTCGYLLAWDPHCLLDYFCTQHQQGSDKIQNPWKPQSENYIFE